MKDVDWDKLSKWITSAEAEGVLTSKQATDLMVVMQAIHTNEFDTALEILNTSPSLKSIQPQLIKGIIDVIKELKSKYQPSELNRVLILTPKNSMPNNPIRLTGKYHTEPSNVIEIGKGENCEIRLVDAKSEEDVLVAIRFSEEENDFKVSQSKNAPVKMLSGGLVAIDDYLFEIQAGTRSGSVPTERDYNKQFPVNLKLLKYEEEKPKATTTLQSLEEIGFRILKEIAPEGRAHPLARFNNLKQWISKNYPRVRVNILTYKGSVFTLFEGERGESDIWLMIIITIDGKNGLAIPACDVMIGPGKVMDWYEGRRYDGIQSLLLANIQSFAEAKFDEIVGTWVPLKKGRINL